MDDLANDTVAVVLAGGKGTRLDPLTRRICKPALPFGGAYRSIDFSLSNCVNSGIRHIGIATQHKPDALLEHIDSVWRDTVTAPGQFVAPWPAEERAPRSGYRGTADAVYRNLELIESLGSRLVLILAGDHVYKMDYRPMLEHHYERGAVATVGCVAVAVEEASQFGIMSIDRNGRIDRFTEKPKTFAEIPAGASASAGGDCLLASMGIYVFDADLLARALRLDAFSRGSRHDFGGDILPRLIREAEAVAYRFRDASGEPAYWRDIGTVSAYWRAHMELLGPSPHMRLDDPLWPLRAADGAPRVLALHDSGSRRGEITKSLVTEDCSIGGEVHHSVLFGGVEVGPGADVADAVVLPGAVVGRDCRLRGVIVDGGCRVPDGTVIDRTARGPCKRSEHSAHGGPVVVTAEDVGDGLVYARA